MMDQDDTFDFKQKISNGFADSILASSPTKNGAMNANSLSDGCDSGEGDHDHLMHDIHSKEKSGFSQSGSPSPSPDSCSPCPNGEDQDQADQYHNENSHHMNLDAVWQNGPAAVQQFTNQGGRKDGDSGFISPEGATNGSAAVEGKNLMDGSSLHQDLKRQSSDGLMEFEVNRTPSLDVEIDSKPLDLSLDSDVDGLASSVHDKNEDKDDDFDILEDDNEKNQNDEIDNFSCEKEPLMNNHIEDHLHMDTKEDHAISPAKQEINSNDDDGLGLEQDEILEDELIKSKLELKDSTDSEKEKEVNINDYEYRLKEDDGCQEYDPMTTSMIQPMDPMTSSMINFDTQAINHGSHTEGESESLEMNENNLMQNKADDDFEKSASSSEDEEDHTEKKDKEKDHSSSSSSDSEEEDAMQKDSFKKRRSSRSSSSSEDEENDQNDMKGLLDSKQSSDIPSRDSHAEMEASKELEKDVIVKNNYDDQSSSSEEENEINDDDKDMGSEKDLIPYSAMNKDTDEQSSEEEEEKYNSDEKHQVAETIQFSLNEIPDTLSANEEKQDKVDEDNENNFVENSATSNNAEDNLLEDSMNTSEYEMKDREPDQYFEKSEVIQDNASSILGDVCSTPDMHSDEVKMNVEQDVFAADKSADNVHPEDEREDCPISNADSRSGSRKDSLGSVSSEDANEHDDSEDKKLSIDSNLIVEKSDKDHSEKLSEVPCYDDSFQSKEVKNVEISPVKQEDIDFEVVNQNADLPNKPEDADVCYKPENDTMEQIGVAGEIISSNTDNDESEDVIMKESMVTNISEGRPADFGFELSESIDHETRDESPTMQTEFFEKNKTAQDDSKGAFSEQTSSKIESNEFCYQENEDTSSDLASLNSQVPAGVFSSGEIAENAAVPLVDENIMVDDMSNIKETEFLVETSTNLAGSQEPSEIFSQNDEHMVQKASEFGVNGEYENSNDKDETNNSFEDKSTENTSSEAVKQVTNEILVPESDMSVNAPQEIYENTTFELNSTEKDSVFDHQNLHKGETIDDINTENQNVDNESEPSKVDMDSHTELSTETEQKMTSNCSNELKEDTTENTGILDTEPFAPETEKFDHMKVNELESKPDDTQSNNYESNLQEENKESLEIHGANEEKNMQESVKLIEEVQNVSLVEKSNTILDQEVTELPKENEIVTEKVSEIDLQTGIQDSEPAIEIETTKEPQVETHLTSQELNANTSPQNIENAEDVKKDTTETSLEPSIISLPVALPVEETKKSEEIIEDKTESADSKKTSKPTPKTTNTSKTTGSAIKPSKPSAPTSTRKTDAAKAPAKPSPRPAAAAPKSTSTKAGPAGGQAPATRRSVPPAKPNTTAPKTTAGSAPSANANKPGTTTKPQTNGVSRPTSATTRTTTRPASAKPATTPSTTKTPTSRPQTAKPSSAPAKTPSSRPATAGTTKTATTTRTPLSTRTTPLTRPSPVPSTLRPRPTSTSRLRAASATRKAQAASATNGTSKTQTSASKTVANRTPLSSRPSPRTPTSSTAATKAQTKPTTTTARPAPSKTTPARPTPSKPTPGTKKPAPAAKTPTKPGSKAPVSKGSTKPVAIKKPSAENAEENNKEENEVNGLSNGVHPIANGVNGVHSDDEGQSLKMNGCNGALDCPEPVH